MDREPFCLRDLFMTAFDQMDSSWQVLLVQEWNKPYMQRLFAFLAREVGSGKDVYPPVALVFNAFRQTPFGSARVVIMGQDPYSGPGQAHGLSFSVPEGVPIPPSLQNVFNELSSDLGVPAPKNGCLIHWARQGVLLLNAVLTVRKNEPRSHYGKGWEEWTDCVIRLLAARPDPLVFLLWGKAAQEKCRHIGLEPQRHLILTAAHPSPLSSYAGFFGCRHFSKTNDFLLKNGFEPIEWSKKATTS